VTSLDVLSKYLLIMELRFEAMLYSNWCIENFDAGHTKCSRRPHLARGVPPLNLKHIVFLKHAFLSYNKYSTRKFYLQIKLLCVMNLVLCDERTEGSQVEMAEQTLHLGSQHTI